MSAAPATSTADVTPHAATALAGALLMASRGFRVFRLAPNTKKPFAHGHHEATTDSAVIQSWARDWTNDCTLFGPVNSSPPEMNFGYCLGDNHVGLDFDLYKPGGPEDRAALGEIPRTFRVRSPRGGEHHILTITRQISQEKPRPTIDVKHGVGYLVCPGSTFEGKPYVIIEDAPFASCPPHIDLQLGKKAEPAERGAAWVSGTCGDWKVMISADLWARIRTEGADRSDHCYRVLCDLFALGLTDDDVEEVVAEPGTVFANKFVERGDFDREVIDVRAKWNKAQAQARERAVAEFGPVEAPPIQAPAVRRLAPVRADTIQQRAISWLVFPYIPAGAISLIGSRGGAGKGLVCSALAGAGTTGGTWATSHERVPLGRVLWAEAEDPAPQVLVPRWRAAGADLSLIDSVDLKTYAMAGLKDYVREQRPRLLVFSPFTTFLDGLSDNNSEIEARAKLQAIQEAIEGTECAAVGICHLNKKADLAAVERLLGTVAFTNFVRSVMLINVEDPSTKRARLVHAKFNWSPRGPDMVYTPRNIGPPRGQEILLDWERPEADVDPDSLYDRKKNPAKQSANDWLVQFLQINTMVPKEKVIAAGLEAGFKADTLEKAHHRNSRCQSRQEGYQGKAIWWIKPE
jgi:Bifunctional DNA primase/polymerase, N-terminal/AAA domain